MSTSQNTEEETASSENNTNQNSGSDNTSQENNTNNRNSNAGPRRSVTIPIPVMYGPPRPSSTTDSTRHGTTPTPRNNIDNNDNNSNSINNGTTVRWNMVPGQPLTMRVINGGHSNSSNPSNSTSAASAAAFAALHHPHVRVAMARHSSRSSSGPQSTADNAAGQPRANNNNNGNNNGFRTIPAPRISIISQTPVTRATTSSSTDSLPPLEVQALPYSSDVEKMNLKSGKNDVCNNKDHLKKLLKKMECRICFEYMDSPVGCPNESCDARFCSTCLHRSVASSHSLQTNNENDEQQKQLSKCPCCRKEFPSATFITPDMALKQQIILNQITTVCPFPNCQERVPLSQLKNHEKTCEYMPMRCKYYSMGCAWTGPKRDLTAHVSLGCAYAKVNGLVEQLRKSRSEQEQTTQHFNHQMTIMRIMIMEQGQLLANMQTKNINNIMDLLHLTFTCTCHTHRFLSVGKPMWTPCYQTSKARATVTNFLCLLPWLLWVIKIFIEGVHCLLNINEYTKMSISEISFEIIGDIMLSFALLLIGFLLVYCFHVDDGTSMEWTQYRLPSFILPMTSGTTSRPLLRDSVSLASLALCFTCIEFDENFGKRLCLWLICLTTCTVFPPIVANILNVASQGSSSNNDDNGSAIQNGRAYEVILFGAKYGFLASLCDFIPTLDALLLLRLVKKTFNISDGKILSEETDCMINDMDKGHFLGYLAVARMSSVIAQSSGFDKELQFYFLQLCMASSMQLLVNQYIMKMSILGQKIGSQIAADSTASSQQSSRKINAAFFFGPWIIFLGCILIS